MDNTPKRSNFMLAEGAEKLEKAIKAFEAYFVETGCFVATQMRIPPTTDLLEWGKHGTEWRLLVVSTTGHQLLTSAPLRTRVQTIDLLPELYETARAAAEELTRAVEDATTRTLHHLKTVQHTPRPPNA